MGFGAVFEDDGRQIELWYMMFNNMSRWRLYDFHQSGVFRPFESAQLPAYGVLMRNVWPALTFTRDSNCKRLLYGFSREMAVIFDSLFHAQLLQYNYKIIL